MRKIQFVLMWPFNKNSGNFTQARKETEKKEEKAGSNI